MSHGRYPDPARDPHRLAGLMEDAPVFLALLAGPEHTFVSANRQYRALLGARDLIGKPVREAMPAVAHQGFSELFDGIYATGTPFIGTALPIMLARGEAGALAMERRPSDLAAIVRRTVEEQQTADGRLHLESAATALPGQFDQPRLERAVGNLVANALKYSPGDEPILVRLVAETADAAGIPWATLTIADRESASRRTTCHASGSTSFAAAM